MDNLQTFYGPNAGYVLELYEQYLKDPASVDAVTRATFERWTPEQEAFAAGAGAATQAATAPCDVRHLIAATELAHAIRSRGHLGAHLDPLGSEPLGDPALLAETHGISEAELAMLPPEVIGGHSAEGVSNALEAINVLRAMYSGTISYEFDQVKSPIERGWLRDAVGLQRYHGMPDAATKRALLERLTQVETFERFLHAAFPGQTRFSLEGTDMLIPMLDEIIRGAAESGSEEVIIGMAHRGRLNVLAHIVGKAYGAILSEFMHMKSGKGESITDSFRFGWIGDVKYHLGAEYKLNEKADISLTVTLAPNPSHLEFVNPVVEGMTRAAQESRTRTYAGFPDRKRELSRAILIHGDAAFSGEGIVAETLNLWNLRGYRSGGTIHIITNNQLGYTTEPSDSRSTHFASDLAKGFEIPIIHVNADDPEAALTAIRLAFAYQDEFYKDILIDLVGYRRWGHNEGDEPAFTQPAMYEMIRSHPTVRELYARKLEQESVIATGEAEGIVRAATDVLESAKRKAEEGLYAITQDEAAEQSEQLIEAEQILPPAVPAERLRELNEELLTWPQGFSPNPKLARLLQRRTTTLGDEGGIDWGQAEALAFASILADGTPIRLSGQDTERGTFSQRHAVLHDQNTGEGYSPLQQLPSARASFAVYNSPLSEVAVMGFEYGYGVHAPETLVLWEAQYGDFANVAQTIIDQFVSSGRTKWLQESSLVLLLPHGYEGKGPEHSSARLERFLALSAQNNWRIVNCSNAAQYYHVLRRQAFYLLRAPRPLVVFTPKSLLRNPLASSKLSDLAEGHFQPVLDDQEALGRSEAVRRLVLSSGKMSIDLQSNGLRKQAEDVALIRVEELYPFPEAALRNVLANYPRVREVIWVQEEPKNMGAWKYMFPRVSALLEPKIKLNAVARPESSSPATGFAELYQAEQDRLIQSALGSTIKEVGGSKHGR